MNFSKSFIHYSKVFQSGPTNEANVLIEIKYDVGKTTADGRAAAPWARAANFVKKPPLIVNVTYLELNGVNVSMWVP